MIFTRFSESFNLKEDKKVFSIRVKPFINDCSGRIYFTDIQLQEGTNLTGYTPNTEIMLERYKKNGNIARKRFYKGMVRGKETIVLFNLGKTSAGIDAYIYPIQTIQTNTIEITKEVA